MLILAIDVKSLVEFENLVGCDLPVDGRYLNINDEAFVKNVLFQSDDFCLEIGVNVDDLFGRFGKILYYGSVSDVSVAVSYLGKVEDLFDIDAYFWEPKTSIAYCALSVTTIFLK